MLHHQKVDCRTYRMKTGRPKNKEPRFVTTLSLLSEAIGRSRMTLDRWRKKFPEFPRPRANGRWDVHTVRKFMDEHNLADEPEETVSDGEPSRAHWDRLKAKTDY